MNSKWLAALIVLAVFIGGFLLGYFLPKPAAMPPYADDATAFERPTRGNMERPGMGGPEGREFTILKRLVARLALSEGQRAAFREHISTHRKEVRAIIAESRDANKAQIDSLNQELNVKMQDLLTDEQYQQWQRFYERLKDRKGPPSMGP